MIKTRRFFLFILICFTCKDSLAAVRRVADGRMLRLAITAAVPGDSILMQAGIWEGVVIDFNVSGLKNRPVVLMAEKGGAVFITGKSCLYIGGDYLQVSGLVFENGCTPGNAVVEFRSKEGQLANNSRITECLIRNYSQPRRFDNDNWILLWGKNNRVDHCTFEDKLNTGPTLVVNLNDERSQQNKHRIDHNYFKGRQRFGSNGGESMRIGVSRYSLTASETIVDHNYFERCNGEVEIISVKSGANLISNNYFFECEGGLVLRHGDNNIIENNIFNGNNKEFTGGIRIINSGHKVRNNIMIALAGDRFRSALTVMNGVPNSLINRYYQVRNTDISNNTFIDCRQVLFGGGKDAERTLGPASSTFSNNILHATVSTTIIDDNADGGIFWKNNIASGEIRYKGLAPFEAKQLKTRNWHSFSLPVSDQVGADLSKIDWVSIDSVGAAFGKNKPARDKATSRKLVLTLENYASQMGLIDSLKDGDTLFFANAGAYGLDRPIAVRVPLTILGTQEGRTKTTLFNKSDQNFPALITIENGGQLLVKNIDFDGARDSYGEAAAGIATTNAPMNQHYSLVVSSCSFSRFNEGGYAGIRGSKGTFADSVILDQCVFHNISGTAVNFSDEKDDKGIYNVDYLKANECSFMQILNAAVNVYRGGNDESTTGPKVVLSNCMFSEIDNKEQGVAVKLIGVQDVTIRDNVFDRSGQGGRAIWLEEFRWDQLAIQGNSFYQSGRLQTFYPQPENNNKTYSEAAAPALIHQSQGK